MTSKLMHHDLPLFPEEVHKIFLLYILSFKIRKPLRILAFRNHPNTDPISHKDLELIKNSLNNNGKEETNLQKGQRFI